MSSDSRFTADDWNVVVPIGTPVHYWSVLPTDEPPMVTRTRSQAWSLGNGVPVVSIEGVTGGVALSHLTAILPAGGASNGTSEPTPIERSITALRSLLAQDADWDTYQTETVRSDVAELLVAYHQQAHNLDLFGHAISDQSRRAQEAETRAERAEAAIEQVRALHFDMNAGWPGPATPECSICSDANGPLPWPCPTLRALTPPADPSHRPRTHREAEFLAGYQAATHAIEADR